jgi:hypothetical protein
MFKKSILCIWNVCLVVFFLDYFTISADGEEASSFMKVLNHFQIVNPNIFTQHTSKIGLSKTNMLKKLFQNGQSGTVSFINTWNFNSSSTIEWALVGPSFTRENKLLIFLVYRGRACCSRLQNV